MKDGTGRVVVRTMAQVLTLLAAGGLATALAAVIAGYGQPVRYQSVAQVYVSVAQPGEPASVMLATARERLSLRLGLPVETDLLAAGVVMQSVAGQRAQVVPADGEVASIAAATGTSLLLDVRAQAVTAVAAQQWADAVAHELVRAVGEPTADVTRRRLGHAVVSSPALPAVQLDPRVLALTVGLTLAALSVLTAPLLRTPAAPAPRRNRQRTVEPSVG